MGYRLSLQHDGKDGDDKESLKLVETLRLDHVQTREDNKVGCGNRFTISESGVVGISCGESPSLSIVYPGTDKPPTVLSNDTIYRSATFMKIRGEEYLAAACDEDGCLYLWDIESKTSRKVFDPKLPKEQPFKYMNIFKVNENTIGCGEVLSSSDGSRKVFILKTDTEEWSLSSILRLLTPNTMRIFDMCYTKVTDGTSLVLLCIPHDQRVMAVEMIDGKTRWEVGKQQMGEKFKPWSICTDDDNTVYVADFAQQKIHLLYHSNGTVFRKFDTYNHGMSDIFTVRFHDEYLYVGYKIPSSKYAVSKIKETD